MKKFIHAYTNPNVDRINTALINREYDGDLIEYIVDCCKSLEVLQYVKFLGYEYVTNEADINTSEYIDARNRGKGNKKKKVRYMHLKDSRYAELRLKFQLECKGEVDIITKKLLVPVPDSQGYYTIKGTQYFLMYQVVDKSTYTTKKTLTLKSMIPVSLKMKQETHESTDGVKYTAPAYTIIISKKDVDIMVFYLAKIGITKTLEYFSVDKIMRFVPSIGDTTTNIYFSISSKMFLEIDRRFFEKYNYVKTIAFMFLTIMTNRLTFDTLHSKSFWIETIGALGTPNKNAQYEKGLNTLVFFDRIIDNTTKRILKVHPIHKKNIYSVLRWLISNFNELRKKDNLDLENKRLRCNEYVASLLTRAFSDRVNRIISLGSKVTMKNVREIFKFPGDILIQQLHHSGLLRYDDRVNDLDFFGRLKVTFKGPNSLGNQNENNIPAKFRGIYPSYLGRLDINVCGTSAPGTSATLTPFCQTSGLYFNNNPEPQDFKYMLDKDIHDHCWDDDVDVKPNFDTPETYYEYIKQTSELNSEFNISKTTRTSGDYYIDIYLPEEDDI